MKTKIVIVVIAIIAIIGSLVGYNIYRGNDNSVYAGTLRDGIRVTPTQIDTTGVSETSQFEVVFEEGEALTLEELEGSITFEPSINFTIVEGDEVFTIQPTEVLLKDTLYKITIEQTPWVFQTQTDFAYLGSLPRHQSTNVPVTTGIEMYFSHPGAQVEDYFEIEPKVKGSFEVFGSTVVFVPKELKAETLYTITLKQGLGLKGSEESLEEAVTFSFETAYNESANNNEVAGYFNFTRIVNDLALEEEHFIPFNFSVYNEVEEIKVVNEIYQYDDIDGFMKAIGNYAEQPTWRQFAGENKVIDVKGLDKVLDFDHIIDDPYSYESQLPLPNNLEEGFYVLASTWEDVDFYTFVQVTDLSYYYFSDEETGYFWVNDLATGDAAEGATILNVDNAQMANSDGLIRYSKGEEEGLIFHQIEHEGSTVLHYEFKYDWYQDSQENYWRYIQTDRNLYKPDDTVALYGFLQDREDGSSPSEVTIEIGEQNWYYDWIWPGMGDSLPLVTETVSVNQGFYEGKLDLPNLGQGGYQIEVKSEGVTLATHYIQVENYVKPDYKMSVSKDKEAIFVGDSVNFVTNTAFFEGTPVSNLAVNYNIYGFEYMEGQIETDLDGNASVNYTPKFSAGYQDVVYGEYAAYVRLPESGELYGNQTIRIFVNDINVNLETKLDDEKGTLKATVNTITLDRLNDGSAADMNDYLDLPVEGHELNGTIYRNEWVKEEVGEFYDFINKEVRKRYNYNMEKTVYEQVRLETNEQGVAELNIDLPKEKNVHYTIEIKTNDLQGRSMAYTQYFNEYYRYYWGGQDYLSLEADKEAYHVDDTMELKLVKGDEDLTGHRYLFVAASNGIKKVTSETVANVDMTFEAEFVPNVEVVGIIFNGVSYETSNRLYKDVVKEDYNINLRIETDKDGYKPGEEIIVDVYATYTTIDGREVPVQDAMVNIALVDEALFALNDQQVDTLLSLYSWVNSGLEGLYGSHNNFRYESVPMRYGGFNDVVEESMEMDGDMKMATTAMAKADSGAEVQVRSNFQDTAAFVNMRLDVGGYGQVTITLPDNVTSWRLTGSSISKDLLAGSEVENVNVSLPFFINTNMNTTYLVGDKPYIGVAGYGGALLEDEEITYTAICEAENYSQTIVAKAFEKVHIPLFDLKAGTYKIQVIAETASGLTDGYEESILVVPTYQEKRVADVYKAVEGIELMTNDYGMTTLTFSDASVGQFVPYLYSLYYAGGKRIDQQLISYQAGQLLNQRFEAGLELEEPVLGDYQQFEGGLSLLPYAKADVELTVEMIPYIESESSRFEITSYLYNKYYDSQSKVKSQALLGLTMLGQSTLLELNQLNMVENLDLTSRLNVARAYYAIGDTYMSNLIIDEYFMDDIERFDDMARYVGNLDQDGQYKMSAKLLPLLASLDSELASDMFAYVQSRYSKTYLPSSDLLAYYVEAMSNMTDLNPGITYRYDGNTYAVDFEDYYGKSITIPSSKIEDFGIVSVSGDVTVIVEYNSLGMVTGVTDNTLSVTRKYVDYENNEEKWNFKSGDIVKVIIDWQISDQSIDDYYTVTDYVPSGLVPIKNIWSYGIDDRNGYWYRDVEGQKVSFGVYKDTSNYQPLYYYARVVTPGTYKADRTLIQGNQVLDSYNLSLVDRIVIEP